MKNMMEKKKHEVHKRNVFLNAWAWVIFISGITFLTGVLMWQGVYASLENKKKSHQRFEFTSRSVVGKKENTEESRMKGEAMSYMDQSTVGEPPRAPTPPKNVPRTHIHTPRFVKAVYMTSWTASSHSARERLVKLIDETEINSVVIDIKDERGVIPFSVVNPVLLEAGAYERRIRDMPEFLEELRKKGIYRIARIPVFEDPFFAARYPSEAVKRADRTTLWSTRKGLFWIDPGSQKMWKYVTALSIEAYELGFDEINFDYIRFPSDGSLSDIYFPTSHSQPKRDVIRAFFTYLRESVGSLGIPISADVFGLTTTAYDDLNIGQILEDALDSFDFVAPMVYPSHYAPYSFGLSNPNYYPYATISGALAGAVHRAKTASTSPLKIRPWLQDFDLGVPYGKEEVRLQIQAVYDAGLTSWMLWDPTNIYTREALSGPDLR